MTPEDDAWWIIHEATWYMLIYKGGRLYIAQLRQLPKILVLPLRGTVWDHEGQYLCVPAQNTFCDRRTWGVPFSLSTTGAPTGSAIRVTAPNRGKARSLPGISPPLETSIVVDGQSIMEKFGRATGLQVLCEQGRVVVHDPRQLAQTHETIDPSSRNQTYNP